MQVYVVVPAYNHWNPMELGWSSVGTSGARHASPLRRDHITPP